MSDHKDDVNSIFRFLAERALSERPCAGNHSLSSFFLKCLEGNNSPKSISTTREKEMSDKEYGETIITPYLEPLMEAAKKSSPEDVMAYVKTSIRRKSLSSSNKILKSKSVLQNVSKYVISNTPSKSSNSIDDSSSSSSSSNNILTSIKGGSCDELDTLILDASKKRDAAPSSGGGTKLGLSLDLSASTMKGGKKPRMAHPMSCPPMYLLKQRKKWPGTPMPMMLEKNREVAVKKSSNNIKAPPIETRSENLNFIGLTIPSWKKNAASGDMTLRDRSFGREKNHKRSDAKRLARSILLETVGDWEIYADTSKKSKFYRNTKNGDIQDIPPRGLKETENISLEGIDGQLAPRLDETSREQEDDYKEEEEDEEEADMDLNDGSSSSENDNTDDASDSNAELLKNQMAKDDKEKQDEDFTNDNMLTSSSSDDDEEAEESDGD